MKIACILGSPRKSGNSATLAAHFLKAAGELGAESSTFHLNDLDYRGCQACYACKKESECCVLKDDLSGVLDTVRTSDILVLATPVYFGEVSGQLKLFIDRTFSFLKPDFMARSDPSRLAPGKKLVFIISQGQPDATLFADIFPRYEHFLHWFGYGDSHLIRACGVVRKDDIKNQPELIGQAERLAVELVS